MKVSVVIPTYNSSKFIEKTLDSVLEQTFLDVEILIMDDGSNDNTISILNNYKQHITVFQQPNKGVAVARNVLCEIAQGDLIAFLDHDDIWHPNYLKYQNELFDKYSNAAALFTQHVDFKGYGNFEWKNCAINESIDVQLIEPLTFLKRYNRDTGKFSSMSFCCIPKRTIKALGCKPFNINVSGADDYYLLNYLPLLGPVVYAPVPLVAYRITDIAQSENRLKGLSLSIRALEQLEPVYRNLPDNKLYTTFLLIYSSRLRQYAKFLMGASEKVKARKQLISAIRIAMSFISIIKSVTLLLITFLPKNLQPEWPLSGRQD